MLHEMISPVLDRYDSFQEMIISNQVQQERIILEFRDLKLAVAKQSNATTKLEGLYSETDNMKRSVTMQDLRVQKMEEKLAIDLEKVQQEVAKIYTKIEVLNSISQNKNNEEYRIQAVLDSFQDRIIENFRMIAEDSNNKIRQVESKMRDLNQIVGKAEGNTLDMRN